MTHTGARATAPYKRNELIGPMGQRERMIVEKIDGEIRGHESFEAHAFDRMRQDHERGLKWNLIRSLLNSGFNLAQAKQFSRVKGIV